MIIATTLGDVTLGEILIAQVIGLFLILLIGYLIDQLISGVDEHDNNKP